MSSIARKNSSQTPAISRRELVGGGAAAGIAALGLAGAAGLAAPGAALADQAGQAAADGGRLVPGVYEATRPGLMGEITVHVTFDESSIVAVDVTRCTDMPEEVCGHAVDEMPRRIVDAQSVNVDTVAGATMSSLAIIGAVTDAIEAAGGAGMFEDAPAEQDKAGAADEEADVLVIGGGGSGCMAALASVFQDLDDQPSGLKVVLAEKLDFIGGSMMLSGGGTLTEMPIDAPELVDDPAYMEPLYEYFQSRNVDTINRDFIHALWSVAGDTILKMSHLGAGYMTYGALSDPSAYAGAAVPIMGHVRPFRPSNAVWRAQAEHRWLQGGVQLGQFFQRWLPESGVDVRTNTRCTGLVVEDGEVKGARLSGPDGDYEVRAKKTIVATGGFARNPEMIEQYAPAYEGIIPFVNGGATGEGMQMLIDLGAEVVGNGMIAYIGTDIRYGMWPDFGQPYYQGSGNFMVVNTSGQRFVADGKGYDLYRVTEGIVAQQDKTAFAVIDADNPDYALTDASVMVDYKWKADSIAELAEAIGVDPDALQETVDAYNALYDEGGEDEFGTKAENILPVRTAPFYAVALNPIAIGSLAGVKCDENCQVLVDGEPVPNLYAVGETVFGGNVETTYTGGLSNATALYTARIAAEHAKAAIAAEE